jgi:hypothetical protein
MSNRRAGAALAGLSALVLLTGGVAAARAQTYQDQIGYTTLQNRLGPAVPTGQGVRVAQIEALAPPPNFYLPTGDANTVVVDRTGGGQVSGHATMVGSFFFGAQSIAPAIPRVDAYSADHWIGPAP